jgi:hypothetical protein
MEPEPVLPFWAKVVAIFLILSNIVLAMFALGLVMQWSCVCA